MLAEIKDFFKFCLTSKLILFGLLVYYLFNFSVLTTHFFDFFFFGSSIHYCCQGLDFYQIPNAAYAFLNGGDLTGRLPEGIIQYSKNYITNHNVYHPLLTIVLGGFFILFDPEISIRLWTLIKIFITIFAVFFIYKNFPKNKYLSFSIFIFLISFSQYNEIRISQYQFLFNIFLLFFLVNLAKRKNNFETGVIYLLTLLIKPISLLWFPALMIKRNYSVALWGLFFFAVSTLTFILLGVGEYFSDNILYHLFNPKLTKNIDFMSLETILRNSLNFSPEVVRLIKIAVLGLIYLLAFSKTNIIKIIFLLIIYFLMFYDLIFQYHFSVLGPLLSISLLVLPEFQTKIARLLILIMNLPNTFFIFRLLNIGIINDPVLGVNPTFEVQQLISIFQLLPIFLLTIIVIIPDIRSLFNLKRNVSS